MGWLNLRKKKEEPKTGAAVPAKRIVVREERTTTAVPAGTGAVGADVLIRPRVTEKASAHSARGVYVFEVRRDAAKREVAAAVRALYNITPVKVAVAPIPRKKVTVKGRRGITGGGKKAYVYLRPGDKIEVM